MWFITQCRVRKTVSIRGSIFCCCGHITRVWVDSNQNSDHSRRNFKSSHLIEDLWPDPPIDDIMILKNWKGLYHSVFRAFKHKTNQQMTTPAAPAPAPHTASSSSAATVTNDAHVPQSVLAIYQILKSMGVKECEPRVIEQLLEFVHRTFHTHIYTINTIILLSTYYFLNLCVSFTLHRLCERCAGRFTGLHASCESWTARSRGRETRHSVQTQFLLLGASTSGGTS